MGDVAWQDSLHRWDPWMGQRPDGVEAVQTPGDASRISLNGADARQGSGSGDVPTAETREPSMASPRQITAADCLQLSDRLLPETGVEDPRKPSASFGRNCAPSQALIRDYANHDQPSYSQLRELCKQSEYHKKDTKAVLKTRLGAMGAADKETMGGSSNEMDTSMKVLGKRPRTEKGTKKTGH